MALESPMIENYKNSKRKLSRNINNNLEVIIKFKNQTLCFHKALGVNFVIFVQTLDSVRKFDQAKT